MILLLLSFVDKKPLQMLTSLSLAEQFLYRRGHHELSSYLEDIGEDDRNSDSEQPLADSRNYERPKLSDVDEGMCS